MCNMDLSSYCNWQPLKMYCIGLFGIKWRKNGFLIQRIKCFCAKSSTSFLELLLKVLNGLIAVNHYISKTVLIIFFRRWLVTFNTALSSPSTTAYTFCISTYLRADSIILYILTTNLNLSNAVVSIWLKWALK